MLKKNDPANLAVDIQLISSTGKKHYGKQDACHTKAQVATNKELSTTIGRFSKEKHPQ